MVSASLAVTTTVNALSEFHDVHDDMKDALDDMSQYWGSKDSKYNQTYYDKLVTCFHKYNDSSLYTSQIGAWRGIYKYW
jgi:hypothetical protein